WVRWSSACSLLRRRATRWLLSSRWWFFFFKQKTAYEIGLGIPAEPLFRSHQSFQATAGFRDYAPNAYSSSNGCQYFTNDQIKERSEERRVGKECRSRGSPYHTKKKM